MIAWQSDDDKWQDRNVRLSEDKRTIGTISWTLFVAIIPINLSSGTIFYVFGISYLYQ